MRCGGGGTPPSVTDISRGRRTTRRLAGRACVHGRRGRVARSPTFDGHGALRILVHPRHVRAGGAGGRRPRWRRRRRRHGHLVRGPPRGGRPHPARAAGRRRPRGRPAARGVQRPHRRPRVRRRGVVGRRAHRRGSPTGPTSACTGSAGKAMPVPVTAEPEVAPGRPVGRRRPRRRRPLAAGRPRAPPARAAARPTWSTRSSCSTRRGELAPAPLVSGPDFVSDPRISPDGARLCWLQWSHPDMPWDGTELCVADLRATDVGPALAAPAGRGGPARHGSRRRRRRRVGDAAPLGRPTARCGSCPTASDWWNLYRWVPPGPAGHREGTVEPMVAMDAEIGVPQWVFGAVALRLPVRRAHGVRLRARRARPPGRAPAPTAGCPTSTSRTRRWRRCRPRATGRVHRRLGHRRARRGARCTVDAAGAAGEPEVLRPPRDLGIGAGLVLGARADRVPHQRRADGPRALLPADQPRGGAARRARRPPLLVMIHGGPDRARPGPCCSSAPSTGRAAASPSSTSTTAARPATAAPTANQLRGQWGVVDLDDCEAAARLARPSRGGSTPARLCIRGGSAGGYTTLAALAFRDTFAAGASHYGVADLEALATETHKFESRYLDGLIGPYPARPRPVRRAVADPPRRGLRPAADRPAGPGGRGRAAQPGRDDRRTRCGPRGVPVAYVTFEGEQHGFRQAANIRRALDGELSFYAQVFGFATPPGEAIERSWSRTSDPVGRPSRYDTGRPFGRRFGRARPHLRRWRASSSPRRSPTAGCSGSATPATSSTSGWASRPDELVEVVPGAAALIIRSATQVTAEVLEAGTDLVVVGRAGIGLDNVDVEAATQRGVMVVNAPQSNILSAAEHTMALLLAQARNVPQAHAALVDGRWERSKWEGVELADKTLGVVGLGRIGKLVAQRAHAFGMKLVAYDPFVSAERARDARRRADAARRAGRGGRLRHPARRQDARDGRPHRQGPAGEGQAGHPHRQRGPGRHHRRGRRWPRPSASATSAAPPSTCSPAEPTTDSPLFGLPQVVVTPHLGASTREAQDKAGDTIAEQVGLALAGEFVPFAVNVSAAEATETVRPLPAAGRAAGPDLHGAGRGRAPTRSRSSTPARSADSDTRILTLSVLKGVFGGVTDEPVSYVNAPRIAAERGVEVRDTSTATAHDYVNLITIRGGDHAIGGTLVGLRGEPRIVMLDGHTIDLPPASHMLVVRNDDRPGMIAFVAGRAGRRRRQHRRHAPGPLAPGRGRPAGARHRPVGARRGPGRDPGRRRHRVGARRRLSGSPSFCQTSGAGSPVVSDRTVRGQASPSGFGGSAFLAGVFFVAFCAAVFLAGAFFGGRLLRRRRRPSSTRPWRWPWPAPSWPVPPPSSPGPPRPRPRPGGSSATTRSGLAGAGGGADRAGGAARTATPSPARRRRRRSGRGRRVVGCGRAQRTQHGLHCDAEQDEKPQSAEESTAHDHEANPRADVRPGPCPSPRRTGRPDGVAVGQADVRGARLDAGRRVSAALRNAPAHRRPPSYLRRAPHIGARQPPAPSRPGGFSVFGPRSAPRPSDLTDRPDRHRAIPTHQRE